jgi:hypothetical protein
VPYTVTCTVAFIRVKGGAASPAIRCVCVCTAGGV